ncbi:hypothetical protein CGRA01v4_11745 [Colletotrichum graminicola]|nr:hypothetical protein CGRA01v4_11745 [Colletotrichum graminicola]
MSASASTLILSVLVARPITLTAAPPRNNSSRTSSSGAESMEKQLAGITADTHDQKFVNNIEYAKYQRLTQRHATAAPSTAQSPDSSVFLSFLYSLTKQHC